MGLGVVIFDLQIAVFVCLFIFVICLSSLLNGLIFYFPDFVIIISGRNVLFMDPNEPEDTMCRDLPLAKLCNLMPENESLKVWGVFLKKEHLKNGHFPGSIFWFPLRRKESKLSTNVYKQKNVERLFQSFSVEAPLCLTFLKSLESISITKISKKGRRENILKVNLNTVSLDVARRQRRMFKDQLQACKGFPSQDLTCQYDITIDTNERGKVVPQHFKVLHYLPCTGEKKEKAQMPLVGIAAPLPPIRSDAQGQLFCFLPLPLENVNNTGLPVQVNGYFALDQNRRHVKWKTGESSAEPDVSIFNHLLLNCNRLTVVL